MMQRNMIVIICFGILCWSALGRADTIYLKNGDQITGVMVKQNKDQVTFQTVAMNRIHIKKEFIKTMTTSSPKPQIKPKVVSKKEEKVTWKKTVSLGYHDNSGNTETSKFNGQFSADYKQDTQETNIKATLSYGSSDNKMDEQKWSAMGRYSFWENEKKWFNVGKLEIDHDRFSNIDWRATPSLGKGFYFFNTKTLTFLAEAGASLEYTEYRDATESKEEILFLPRVLFKKQVWDNWAFSIDTSMYQSVEEYDDYRLHSEAVLARAISNRFSLKFSVINDYNAKPSDRSVEKSDTSVISALTYAF